MRISLSKDPENNESGEIIQVKVTSSDDVDAKLEFSHSFKFADVEKGRSVAEEIFDRKPQTRVLRNYGKRLFRALFSQDESSIARQLLQKTLLTHAVTGRIQLELNGDHNLIDHDLDAIPWEYAWSGDNYLVRQIIFTRMVKGESRQLQALPLRIVVVAPDPVDSSLTDLNLVDQFQNLADGFYKSSRSVMLERVQPATVDQMEAMLVENDDKTATVLHFMGHCTETEDGLREQALVFEHPEHGKVDKVKMQRLVNSSKILRLAFLSACNTREIARDIACRGVLYTIGSYCSLPDDIARRFEAKFYHYLSLERSVGEAIWKTRLEMAELADHDNERQRDYLMGAMVLIFIFVFCFVWRLNYHANRLHSIIRFSTPLLGRPSIRFDAIQTLLPSGFPITLIDFLLPKTLLDARRNLTN